MFNDCLVACDVRVGFPASLSIVRELNNGDTGHVTVCQLIIDEVDPAATSVVATPMAVAPVMHRDEEAIKQLRIKAAESRSAMKESVGTADISSDWVQEEGTVDMLAASTLALARVHDLSILSGPRSDDELGWTMLLERMVRESGRPCLVVPHAYEGQSIADNVQISWDGSKSAARAVHDALPLLQKAGDVSIVETADQLDQDGCSGGKLRAHLQRHGVTATVQKLSATDEPVSETLAHQAAAEGCDLIVMGAYNQNWLRRTVLGSVTDETMQNLQIPVFTAH